MALTREDYVTQSVQNYLRRQLFDVRGFPEDQVQILEEWDGSALDTPLTKNYVATGFNFDDGGRQAELGSDLMTRVYTLEFFVFGISATWGRNLANGVKFSLENDGIIPLLDIADPSLPQVDTLVLISVSAQREPTGVDPPQWQQYVWTTTARVEDVYPARMV